MIKPEVLDAMLSAGCSAEQIVAVVKADMANSTNAERQKRYRDRKKAQQSVTDNVTLRNGDAKEIPPTPPKENNTPLSSPKGEHIPPRTPREQLETVLSPDTANAVLEHRKKIRKPLTERAAQLLAAKFAQCPDPEHAANEMISNGWQGFKPEWLDNTRQGAPPSQAVQHQQGINAALRRMRENDASSNESGNKSSVGRVVELAAITTRNRS